MDKVKRRAIKKIKRGKNIRVKPIVESKLKKKVKRP